MPRPFSLLYRGRRCRVVGTLDSSEKQPKLEVEFEDGTTELVDRSEIRAPDDAFPRLGPDV